MIDNTGLFRCDSTFSFSFYQMPLWLFRDEHYFNMSMNARVTYTFLLNRFRLSQANNQAKPGAWTNEDGDLFVIYPRNELASDLHIALNSAIRAIKELVSFGLISETRPGQGRANRIYLIDTPLLRSSLANTVVPAESVPPQASTAPIQDILMSRAANSEGLNKSTPERTQTCESQVTQICDSEIQNRKNGFTFVPEPEIPESQKWVASNIYINKINSGISTNKSVSQSRAHTGARKCELDRLDAICESADLNLLFDPAYGYSTSDAKLMQDSIHRLFFTESLTLDKASYPQEYIRSRLGELTIGIIDTTLERLRQNVKNVRNKLSYAAKTLFSCILESETIGKIHSHSRKPHYGEPTQKNFQGNASNLTIAAEAAASVYAAIGQEVHNSAAGDGLNFTNSSEDQTPITVQPNITDVHLASKNSFVSESHLPIHGGQDSDLQADIVKDICACTKLPAPVVGELCHQMAYADATVSDSAILREAKLWDNIGISCMNDVQQYADRKKKEAVITSALLDALNQSHRTPTISETYMIAFAAFHGFEPAVMKIAVDQTVAECGRFSVDHARGLMEEWNRLGKHEEDSICEEICRNDVIEPISAWEQEWLNEARRYHTNRRENDTAAASSVSASANRKDAPIYAIDVIDMQTHACTDERLNSTTANASDTIENTLFRAEHAVDEPGMHREEICRSNTVEPLSAWAQEWLDEVRKYHKSHGESCAKAPVAEDLVSFVPVQKNVSTEEAYCKDLHGEKSSGTIDTAAFEQHGASLSERLRFTNKADGIVSVSDCATEVSASPENSNIDASLPNKTAEQNETAETSEPLQSDEDAVSYVSRQTGLSPAVVSILHLQLPTEAPDIMKPKLIAEAEVILNLGISTVREVLIYIKQKQGESEIMNALKEAADELSMDVKGLVSYAVFHKWGADTVKAAAKQVILQQGQFDAGCVRTLLEEWDKKLIRDEIIIQNIMDSAGGSSEQLSREFDLAMEEENQQFLEEVSKGGFELPLAG